MGRSEGSQRQLHMELLRVLSMCMIVGLHLLSKGGILADLAGGDWGAWQPLYWALEALCLASVNVFALFTGYYGGVSPFRSKKALALWAQILFYSLGTALVFWLAGALPSQAADTYHWLHYLFPVQMRHYWFATAYVALYLFTPFLEAALARMPRQALYAATALLLLFYSVIKSLLPVRLEIDSLGYDWSWLLCVYLVGACLRRWEGEDASSVAGRWWVRMQAWGFCWYLFCSAGIFGLWMLNRLVFLRWGWMGEYFPVLSGYNHVLNLASSCGLFCGFLGLRVPASWGRWILPAGASALGVYLLHEHILLRYRWPVWLGVEAGWRLWLAPLQIGVVYLAGMAVEALRRRLFILAGSLPVCRRMGGWLERLDAAIRAGGRADEKK